jgi:hypothetical protein
MKRIRRLGACTPSPGVSPFPAHLTDPQHISMNWFTRKIIAAAPACQAGDASMPDPGQKSTGRGGLSFLFVDRGVLQPSLPSCCSDGEGWSQGYLTVHGSVDSRLRENDTAWGVNTGEARRSPSVGESRPPDGYPAARRERSFPRKACPELAEGRESRRGCRTGRR